MTLAAADDQPAVTTTLPSHPPSRPRNSQVATFLLVFTCTLLYNGARK